MLLSFGLAVIALANVASSTSSNARDAGHCTMYDTCDRSGFSTLPCAVSNFSAQPVTSPELLSQVCGYNVTTSCCTNDQLIELSTHLQQAQVLIATCPACVRNFRDFYCALTCSPNQAQFLTVTASKPTPEGDLAVQGLAYHVEPHFGQLFFDSCKNVKFGATNGYAMDLIGGGAKDWTSFVSYMGTKRPGLGSPFQIDFPQPPHALPNGTVDDTIQPFDQEAAACDSPDVSLRCACADCPDTCLELPAIQTPADLRASTCHVGKLDCFSFFLVILYSVSLFTYLFGTAIMRLWERHRSNRPLLRPKASNLSGGIYLQGDDHDHESVGESTQSEALLPSSSSGRGVRSGSIASSAGAFSYSPSASLSKRRLGRGASLLEADNPLARHQPRVYVLNTILYRLFYNLGHFSASKPYLVISMTCAICGLLNSGWSRFAIEKDPVNLWVSPHSDSAANKQFFDSQFGPFYRTEQFFITDAVSHAKAKNQATLGPPVLTWERLQWIANLQDSIASLSVTINVDVDGSEREQEMTLTDFCFAPSGQASDVSDCVVQSLLGYFPDLRDEDETTWKERLDDCAKSPALCLPANNVPLNPRLLFGGIPGFSYAYTKDEDDHSDAPDNDDWKASDARAVVITYVVQNSLDPEDVQKVEAWEQSLRALIQSDIVEEAFIEHGLHVSFSTGVSLEEELNKSTNTDVPIVVLSYVLMFLYVALNLGGSIGGLFEIVKVVAIRVSRRLRRMIATTAQRSGAIRLEEDEGMNVLDGASPSVRMLVRQLLVNSKFLLGLWSILIVLLSVSTSVGFFSLLGIKTTLIIAEVIPFLVLAIGVDNVFLLSHELQKQNNQVFEARHIVSQSGIATEQVGEDVDPDDVPPVEERIAQALGRMGPSILSSATCESVTFALGALVGMPAVRNFAIYAAGAVVINTMLQVTAFVSLMSLDLSRTEANRADCIPCLQMTSLPQRASSQARQYLSKFIQNTYAPFLLHKTVKKLVLFLFSLLFVLSWVGSRNIQLGLDQRLALPAHSYLVDYFDMLDKYLDVGPPVYFVAQGPDVTSRDGQQALCARFSTCRDFSLAGVLEAERKRSGSSFLAEPPASWIDDFFQWLNPALETCCRVKIRNTSEFCSPEDSDFICQPCYKAETAEWNITMEGLPQGEQFMRYLKQWLHAPTDENCPLGGQASYSTALVLEPDDSNVYASHFRTFHTPVKTQNDYIDAMSAAERIAADLSDRLDVPVFPYSVFYVFFEQYATIAAVTRQVVCVAILAVFFISSLFLGSFRTGAIVAVTVFSVAFNVLGVMGAWHISLNAISLVNVVISIGIAVEFCSHVARSFMSSLGGGLPFNHPAGPRERNERAWDSLSDVGASVFTGITLTKLIGISVLALTRSKLLKVYYFRMWLILIISGALHGLVLLPVVLSYQGAQGWSESEQTDEQLVREHMSGYEHAPFRDDDSVGSDVA